MSRQDILAEIEAERRRQDAKWGGPEHDDQHEPAFWAQLIQDYTGWARVMAGMHSWDKYRRRLINVAALAVAALAVAAVEVLDRRLAGESAGTDDPSPCRANFAEASNFFGGLEAIPGRNPFETPPPGSEPELRDGEVAFQASKKGGPLDTYSLTCRLPLFASEDGQPERRRARFPLPAECTCLSMMADALLPVHLSDCPLYVETPRDA